MRPIATSLAHAPRPSTAEQRIDQVYLWPLCDSESKETARSKKQHSAFPCVARTHAAFSSRREPEAVVYRFNIAVSGKRKAGANRCEEHGVAGQCSKTRLLHSRKPAPIILPQSRHRTPRSNQPSLAIANLRRCNFDSHSLILYQGFICRNQFAHDTSQLSPQLALPHLILK